MNVLIGTLSRRYSADKWRPALTYLLTDLLAGFAADIEIEAVRVSGVSSDSRAIVAGEAFFALPGVSVHGDAYIAQAVENGAVAVVTDRAPVAHPGVSVIVLEDVRAAYAMAAARSLPPQPETLVGVTGTSGKTSIASFVRQIWQACGIAGASVGTLGIEYGDKSVPTDMTTPDALTLHKSMQMLKEAGADHVALEASSHGLDQRRLDGMAFKAVGFSNLGHDHLDYHADMDAYRDAKLRLFRDLLADEGFAVVNSDDPEHMPFMFAALDSGATLLTVGEEGAYFEISSVEAEGFGQRVTGKLVGEPVEFLLPLTGRFQVTNAALAAALAIQTGADKDEAIEALNHLKGAKGRMEMVGEHQGGAIFVDYSHKPMALEAALETLRPLTKGKLIVVFGCGGDRDKEKRPMMGEIAARLADEVIVTDDNPRTEDAASIRAEILGAASGAQEIGDRGEAITAAVSALGTGDVLLVAGKGHEEYQLVGTEKLHFSDHESVAAVLNGA